MALDAEVKSGIIKNHSRTDKDTGSPEVQIALLTERIKYLTEHLKINKKDHASRVGLLKLVSRRKRLMKYLKRTKKEVYSELIEKLSIRDNI
jgi:small subunit ribosomal protein S15